VRAAAGGPIVSAGAGGAAVVAAGRINKIRSEFSAKLFRFL
jgi:hypothetical protein